MSPTLRRVMVVDGHKPSAQALSDMLRELCGAEVWVAPTNARAMKLAAKVDPHLVVCDYGSEAKLNGPALTRDLRRSDLACRKAAVILMTSDHDPAKVLAARDAGAHEFLRKPFTVKDVARRVQAATLLQRPWVEAVDYVGPDRRRFNLAEFNGPSKRLADQDAAPESLRIGQALKILRSALEAIERDPQQALRAMRAQADELQEVATIVADHRLAAAAYEMQRYLGDVAAGVLGFERAEATARAAGLLAYGAREGRVAA